MTNAYVTAVLAHLEAGKDPALILSNLKATLERKGHSKIHRAILLAIQSKLKETGDINAVMVTTASETGASKHAEAINAALTAVNSVEHQKLVDNSIVGGFIVKTKNQLVDASYKSKLISLYRKLS